MAKALRDKQDIILIPKHWWPDAKDTLDPEELGWWYKYQRTSAFKNVEHAKRDLLRITKMRHDAQNAQKKAERGKTQARRKPKTKIR
jgi:hypothetical protein